MYLHVLGQFPVWSLKHDIPKTLGSPTVHQTRNSECDSSKRHSPFMMEVTFNLLPISIASHSFRKSFICCNKLLCLLLFGLLPCNPAFSTEIEYLSYFLVLQKSHTSSLLPCLKLLNELCLQQTERQINNKGCCLIGRQRPDQVTES